MADDLHMDGDQIISVIEGGGQEGLQLVVKAAGFVERSELKPECFRSDAPPHAWSPTARQWWAIGATLLIASAFWLFELEKWAAISLVAGAFLLWRLAPVDDRHNSGRRYVLTLAISAIPGGALVVRGRRSRRRPLSPEMRRLLGAAAGG